MRLDAMSPKYGGPLGSLKKHAQARCEYQRRREKVNGSYWNNPHVCDASTENKMPDVKIVMVTKTVRRQDPCRSMIGKSCVDKNKIRKEKMENQRVATLKMRALKYGSTISLPPEPGRTHIHVQTCDLLEEIYDHPPTTSTCSQTISNEIDELPPFIPEKTGVDTCTQIYPGDLFYFDDEVKPILEVTVGRTIEQALLEVFQEDEIEGMERERQKHLEQKAIEEAEIQRLEEEERRKNEEKMKRIAELEEAKQKQKELEERIAAVKMSENIVQNLLPNVLEDMTSEGYYDDLLETTVRDEIMKTIDDEITEELSKIAESKDILMDMISDIVQERYDIYANDIENTMNQFLNNLSEISLGEIEEEVGRE